MQLEAIYKAIEHAVDRAFAEVGVEGFKKTSLFMSNLHRAHEADLKKAA